MSTAADRIGDGGENRRVAKLLGEVAALLEEQEASAFRVAAYRRAAEVVAGLAQPVGALLRAHGVEGLERLPAIGPSIARGIREIVRSGRLPMLDRLREARDPVALLTRLPFVGPALADRLHHDLGIDSLEELELAVHDGRVASLPGFGPKRIAALQDALAARLGRRRPTSPPAPAVRPPVAELLDVDREYRDGVERGALPRIAPRRFNPRREAWLPILHTDRSGREYTVLFSNTARAHQLGRTRDWVVLYFDGPDREHQATVVTERQGPLRGRRVVRGRERECLEHYGVEIWPASDVAWFEGLRPEETGSATERALRGAATSSGPKRPPARSA